MEPISLDQNDQQLIERTHPTEWENPAAQQPYDLLVIGGGPAGMVAAVIAAGLGAKTALVERHRFGGDCLHTGCVPSKALLASAQAAYQLQQGCLSTVTASSLPEVDFSQVMHRMRGLRARLSEHDAAHRFQQLGIDVFFGNARFDSRKTVQVEESQLTFRRCILATGSRPAIPAIEGLEEANYLTNETLFSLTERPPRLVILGAGPVGVEMAQAFHRFGSNVTLIDQAARLLPREDVEASEILAKQFEREGIQVRLDTRVRKVESSSQSHQLYLQGSSQDEMLEADQLLLATGRQANIGDLGLDAADIRYTDQGVEVNQYLRTTNRRVFAAGDVTGDQQFTHAADMMARLCVRNAFFFGRQNWSKRCVPHTTYTDPEVAHIGITASEAARQGITIDTYRESFSQVDRAILEGTEGGQVTVHCRKGRGEVLGATIVGSRAGEMINTVSLLMSQKLTLGALSNTIHCYPTRSQVLQRIGDQFQRRRLRPWSAGLLKRIISWRR